jgi:hypothetical protein
VEGELHIVGLAGLLEKERTAGAKTEGLLTERLLEVGDQVADDVRHRYIDYSAAGANGVEAKVFTSGLWVVQTIRKSRSPLRRRPNFGPLMMRKAFLPAAHDNEAAATAAATAAVAEVTAYWNS